MKELLENLYNNKENMRYLRIITNHRNYDKSENMILDEIQKDSINLSVLKKEMIGTQRAEFKIMVIFYLSKYALLLTFLEDGEQYEKCANIYTNSITLLNEIFDIPTTELERLMKDSLSNMRTNEY